MGKGWLAVLLIISAKSAGELQGQKSVCGHLGSKLQLSINILGGFCGLSRTKVPTTSSPAGGCCGYTSTSNS